MAELPRSSASDGEMDSGSVVGTDYREHRTPRWVVVFGLIVLALIVLAVGMHLAGGSMGGMINHGVMNHGMPQP